MDARCLMIAVGSQVRYMKAVLEKYAAAVVMAIAKLI
jgi:hypothetical protein